MRIGHGYDVHQLAENRKLIIGGIEIPHHLGLLGHSDADVLLHAICDSILGAAALGDIGTHFPDTDNSLKGIDSGILLEKTVKLAIKQGYNINNIDTTIVAQKPKLAAFLPMMKRKIAQICAIDPDQINIKATTTETLGFTGKELGIAAHAVTLLSKLP